MKMKKNFLFFLLPIACLFIGEVKGQDQLAMDQQAMIEDLASAKYKFSSRYAMSEWKGQQFSWTLEGAYQDAKTRINAENSTIKEYQKIFNGFLNSTKDYHVRGIYYSTAISFFPLKIKGANNHYYIMPLNDIAFEGEDIFFISSFENFEQEEFQNLIHFGPGDEVIAFNGTPIHEVIEKIIDEDLGGDRTATGYALAEKILFFRKGKFGMTLPSGHFEITVRHKDKESLETYSFKWICTPELIKDPKQKAVTKKVEKKLNAKSNAKLVNMLKKDYTVGFAKDLLQHEKSLKLKKISLKRAVDDDYDDDIDEEDDFREKGFLPELGQLIWETDPEESEIYAYLYLNAKGQKIGYIHIPTFMEDDEDVVDEIVEIMRHFEHASQALIVDITDNPGGSLLYTYAVLSTLTNYPLKALPEREVLIQEDVYNAIMANKWLEFIGELMGTLSGYPVNDDTFKQLINYNEEIIQSWNSGKRITDLLYPLGIREIMPHPAAQYSKPLVVLTNELDFSCADWFPAILQDNGRAVIFGSKTAGAGGSVVAHPHMSQFGVQAITITGSIGFRLDGTPIENLGVTPDIPYQITENDLKDNYTDYKRTLNKVVETMIR